MDDVFVYLINMPNKARAVTVPCGDCDYTIYVNSQLTFEMQEEAFHHEMRHINSRDFDGENDVDKLEMKRSF